MSDDLNSQSNANTLSQNDSEESLDWAKQAYERLKKSKRKIKLQRKNLLL